MKKKLTTTAVLFITCIGALFSQIDQPKLTKVTITFTTHNDNKDDDTRLDVSIKNKSTIFLSQELAKGENLGGKMEFKDPSVHSFNLQLSSKNIKMKDIKIPLVDIDIQPNGNDTWIFDYTVKLTFDDGNSFTSKSKGLILDQDNKHYEGVFQN